VVVEVAVGVEPLAEPLRLIVEVRLHLAVREEGRRWLRRETQTPSSRVSESRPAERRPNFRSIDAFERYMMCPI